MATADQQESQVHEQHVTVEELFQQNDFIRRHIGPRDSDVPGMLKVVGAESLQDLIRSTVPTDLLLENDSQHDPQTTCLPQPTSEHEALDMLAEFAGDVSVRKSFIGQGYYGTIVPNVCLLYTSDAADE